MGAAGRLSQPACRAYTASAHAARRPPSAGQRPIAAGMTAEVTPNRPDHYIAVAPRSAGVPYERPQPRPHPEWAGQGPQKRRGLDRLLPEPRRPPPQPVNK